VVKVSNLTSGRRIAAAYGWFNRIRHRQVAAMCPPMRAHWCHVANTTELMLPSAHLSPQLKRQIDRFSRFCTAHCRKSLYFTMGAPIPQNCLFPRGSVSPSKTRAHNPNGTSIGSAVFAQMTTEFPCSLQWFAPFPSKLPHSYGGSGPSLTHGSLGPPESSTKRYLDRFSRFCKAH